MGILVLELRHLLSGGHRRKGRIRNNIKKRRKKGKRIRSEKRQGYSRFPAGQKDMATVGKTTDRMPPRKLQQNRSIKKT